MKHLIFLVSMAFIFSGSFAQKNDIDDPIYGEDSRNTTKSKAESITKNNFLIENNKLIWQKVFETKLGFESLVDKIKTAGILENIEISESKITGDLRRLSTDYRGAGFTGANTPIIVASGDLTGYIVLDYKDNKYRTTARNITLIQRFDNTQFFKQGQPTKVDLFAIKDGSFKKAFLKTSAVIIDYSFTNALLFDMEKINDNW